MAQTIKRILREKRRPDGEAMRDALTGDFLAQMHRYVAYTSVGPSTVRGQRTPGLVAQLRELLSQVDLDELAACQPPAFPDFLNRETSRIQEGMPDEARYWGIARKVLNIFLRAATYNHYLRRQFPLDRFESVLELPMDSLTALGLKARSPARSLPRWQGVKHLTQADNQRFQARALEIADAWGIPARVHLDIYFWLERGQN
jgi:hypothetical protein